MPDFDTPVAFGDHWVLVTPEDVTGPTVIFHVSISVPNEEALNAADLSVTATGGGVELVLMEGPADGTLPIVVSGGATAFAQYIFANEDLLTPIAVTVDFGGASAEFALSDHDPNV